MEFDFLASKMSQLYQHSPGSKVPWRIAVQPFELPHILVEEINALGDKLVLFYQAANKLYLHSVKKHAPGFVQYYLEKGKPETIIKLMQQNYHAKQVPSVIRPDLLLLNEGFGITELDSVPGGLGFTATLASCYSALGYSVIGAADGMLKGFTSIFPDYTKEQKAVALIVSDEGNDYLLELQELVRQLNEHGSLLIYVCRPQQINYIEDKIYIKIEEQTILVSGIYRFFELFDLPNIPKHELIRYAASHKQVFLTPPLKAQLEEKLLFSFLWHPELESFWLKELGPELFNDLCRYIPRTWILDPTPMPPQACIAGLEIQGSPVFSWQDLGAKSLRKERDYVIKPSGFSALAWGSKGVHIGDSLCKEAWDKVMEHALHSFETTPYIIQKKLKTRKIECQYYHPENKDIATMVGRVRLCPYFFNNGNRAALGGILATISPIDSEIVHGTPESIMTTCMYSI